MLTSLGPQGYTLSPWVREMVWRICQGKTEPHGPWYIAQSRCFTRVSREHSPHTPHISACKTLVSCRAREEREKQWLEARALERGHELRDCRGHGIHKVEDEGCGGPSGDTLGTGGWNGGVLMGMVVGLGEFYDLDKIQRVLSWGFGGPVLWSDPPRLACPFGAWSMSLWTWSNNQQAAWWPRPDSIFTINERVSYFHQTVTSGWTNALLSKWM